ncbi:MAG: non-ribosomal peptide synthetase [Frankiaceae bacterium]
MVAADASRDQPDGAEIAAAATVLRCYSGSPRVRLVLPDGRVVESGPAGGEDLTQLTGIPATARMERRGERIELAFDGVDVPQPYQRCMGEDLAAVLALLRADPDRPARNLLPSPATERLGRHLGAPSLPAERSVPEAFWRRVEEFAERPALIDGGEAVSYRGLADRVAALAALLGPGPAGRRVGLLLDHGADTVAAILAVLSVGGAYVPLDPRYPVTRLQAMAAQAQVSAVLTAGPHRPLAQRLAAGTDQERPAAAILDIADAPAAATRPERSPPGPHAPAYVLHTSGSTGVPKGVVQTHGNVLHQVRLHRDNLRITPDDRLSVVSSFSFDMAVTDTFSALLTGACCVPVDVRALGLTGLADALRRHRVTIYHSTPTVLRYLADSLAATADPRLPDLRVVVLGGEPVTREDLRRCRRHIAADGVLVNGYGATEISFAVQDHLLLAESDGAAGDEAAGDGTGAAAGAVLPIGYPLAGVRIGLLAPDGSPAAVAGEIAISSERLAAYWADPQETAARFDTDHDGVRRYRTGDLARRLPDGRLLYLGRRDRQVKVRGHRVEPAEIEHALGSLAGVAHAAVVAGCEQGEQGEQGLHAFVTAAGGQLHPAAVRASVAELLPDYLVPATVTVVSELPLTPTGKIDARALLERYLPRARGSAPEPAGTPGAGAADDPDGLERAIAVAWAEALGRDGVGRHDRFFDVGGHSLLAARVHQRLVEDLGRPFPLTAMYAHPTVADLADHLRGAPGPVDDASEGTAGSGAAGSGAPASAAARMARRRAARTRRG